jgi:hypothetical protein
MKITRMPLQLSVHSEYCLAAFKKILAPGKASSNYENPYFCNPADVAKLADAPDLGSGAARHVGSTPIIRT